MKRIFLILICIEAILFPNSFAQKQPSKQMLKQRDKYIFSVKHEKHKFTESVPFKFPSVMNEIIIPVTINGKVYHFLFDTGAITLISKGLKKKLGLQSLTSIPLSDASSITHNITVYRVDSLSIGHVSFYDIGTVSQDLSAFNAFSCTKIDGIIGTNIMTTYYWKVDYKNRLLSLSNRRLKPSKPALTFKFFEDFSGCPNIKAVLGKFNFSMIWDSGSTGYLSFQTVYFSIVENQKMLL